MTVFVRRARRVVAWPVAAGLAAVGGAALAQADGVPPTLRCDLRYSSASVSIAAQPTRHPYDVKPNDIEGRFAFKAVVVGDAQQIDYVALYAYDLSVRQAPVLVHEVVHTAPRPDTRPVPALTGWNHVYSSNLGRELVYGCALQAP